MYHRQVISIDGASIELNLVTMKRSFLIAINNVDLVQSQGFDVQIPFTGNEDNKSSDVTRDDMIRGFMDSNMSMQGLSLAIGKHNTCLINSDNSLASATLASRLSRKLNLDRPVYVANNFQFPDNTVESDTFQAKLYMKVFQFVNNYYKCEK